MLWKWKSLSSVRLFATPWTIVHGILQARILEWVAFPFSRGSSEPRDRTQVSRTAGRFFTSWATRTGEGNRNPLQYSRLENPIDGGAWWAAVHGVAKSQTWLSNFTFTFHFHALEKEMTIHSSVLAWRIPGTGEPGELPSMGSRGVGHDWSDLAAAAAAQYIMTTSVVTYRCEGWTIKKAECQRTNTFELWCCRRLLGVPWTARRSNQSIPKEINPEYSLERLMLKLNLQYFGHLMQRVDSLEKEPDPGKDWRQKEKRVAENEMVR